MDLSNVFLGEMLGTMTLILLGNGVVANVLYKRTGGSKGGIITIAFGWAFAVFVGVLVANAFGTGGHLNPAVTLMQWVAGTLNQGKDMTAYAFTYFGAEFVGAILGQILVVIFYWNHSQEDENKDAVLSTHSTGPTHENKTLSNLFSEFVGTTVLLAVVMSGLTMLLETYEAADQPGGQLQDWQVILNNISVINNFLGPITVALTVFAIGVSLGGTTGYAINPFRDLAPRIVYQFTPYKNKVSANWAYSWVPVAAPLAASVMVGLISRLT